MIDDDDARALLGAYALDAVDDDERAAVDALVATDPAAARELASLLAVSATLGDAVAAEPPPALRASVLAAVAGTAQAAAIIGPRQAAADAQPSALAPAPTSALRAVPDESAPTSSSGSARDGSAALESSSEPVRANVTDLASRRRPTTRWFAIAAAVVVGAAIPTAFAVQQAQRADHAEQQQLALADLLTDPSAVVVHGTMPGGGTATAVMTDSQALISAADMPDPGAGHVYQLWVVSGGAATSAGILADSAGSARALTDDFAPGDSLAVTIEPTGGSAQPTTTPVLVLSAT